MPVTLKVDSVSSAYLAMAEKWLLLHDLRSGTLAMRAAGKTWLPLEEKETELQYAARLARSYLYGGYNDTIEKLVSKPFSRPITLQGKLPDPLAGIMDDADRAGRDLTAFGRDIFDVAVDHGLTHVLIDFPATIGEDGKAPTLKDENDQGIRPYFVHVKPPNLIGWRTERQADGTERVTMARIADHEIREDGPFGEMHVDVVWHWTETEVVKYERAGEAKEYSEVSRRTHTYKSVPLFTFYISRTGALTADPPLEDLAWMNLMHWQSMSDQRNILRYARVPILFAAGFTGEEIERGVALGPNQLISSTNELARLGHVEHSGKAIEAGETDLQNIEERMTMLGLQPLVQQSGNQTATGKAIDEGRTHTAIQAWIRGCENFLELLIRRAGDWINVVIPDGSFSIDITNDFGISLRAADDITSLIDARKIGEISRETFLSELKRRGLLAESVEIDEEVGRIEEEGPPMSDLIESPEIEDE